LFTGGNELRNNVEADYENMVATGYDVWQSN